MNKIAIFYQYNAGTLKEEVNIWLEKHSEIEIIKIDFFPANGLSCNYVFIHYKEKEV